MTKYCIDIDGVLCENTSPSNHTSPKLIQSNIDHVKSLQADKNNVIMFYTSRPNTDYSHTVEWLHSLGLDTSKGVFFDKPTADFYVDDKAVTSLPANQAKLSRKKLAICWSGGMDSFLAYHYAIKELGYLESDIILINFELGHNYSDKEKKARDEIGLPFITIPVGLLNADFGNLVDKDSYIIPGRNMIFATIAAGFAETVWIVGVKFENHQMMFDKNDAFYRTSSLALSQALGATTVVDSPFKTWTKTEMVSWAVDNGLKDDLSKTVSCYHDTLKRCGNCGLCFKRAIASFMGGNESEILEYSENPFYSESARGFIQAYREAEANNDYTHYFRERIEETKLAYEHLNINLDWL